MEIIPKDSIAVGDIIFLPMALVSDSDIGCHPFFVISRDKGKLKQLTLLEISSKPKACDTINSSVLSQRFPYNEPIIKSDINGLNQDSHIKCDQLYIYCENVVPDNVRKFGILESDLYYREIKNKTYSAQENGELYLYDQSNNGAVLRG